METYVKTLENTGFYTSLDGSSVPFTVFAPDNAAFNTLPNLNYLLNPDNWQDLQVVMNRHDIPEKNLTAASIAMGETVFKTTEKGILLTVTKTNELITIASTEGKANVIKTDLTFCNGIIHIIDGIL